MQNMIKIFGILIVFKASMVVAEEARDPFSITQAIFNQTQQVKQRFGFKSDTNAELGKLPKLQVQGYLQDKQKRKVALLKIEGAGTFMVKSGDTISLQALGQDTVLYIEEIYDQSVLVQIGTLGQKIVVR